MLFHPMTVAGFRRAAEQMIGLKMPGLVKQYERGGQGWRNIAERPTGTGENRVDRLGTGNDAALEQEIQEYEAYVAENGKRRQEIQALEPRSGGSRSVWRN